MRSRVPKALVEVGGRSLLHWSVGALASAPSVDAVHCVVPAGYEPALDPLRAAWGALGRLLEAIPGGATRQASVRAGLAAVRTEWVLIHDAARCFVEVRDAEQVLAAARETGAAIPVIPISTRSRRSTATGWSGPSIARDWSRCRHRRRFGQACCGKRTRKPSATASRARIAPRSSSGSG